ncbi:MAG: TetR/AcrR family transcriptional regulator [Bacilli bacterium]|nr:TetR/AcrR family transcriptional regulator [Bacilli bacterium]
MSNDVKRKVLHAAVELFLTEGYEKTSIRVLEKASGINYGSIMHAFECKENIVGETLGYLFDKQFQTAQELVKGKTTDKVLMYIVETVLQLYMAESSEHMREMYNVSYTLPNTITVIHKAITDKLEDIFKEEFPNYDKKDFYFLELAASGIMRSYLSRPCDMFFTMEMKVEKFIETLLLIYRVSDERIKEAIDLVNSIDFKAVSQKTISEMKAYMDKRIDE